MVSYDVLRRHLLSGFRLSPGGREEGCRRAQHKYSWPYSTLPPRFVFGNPANLLTFTLALCLGIFFKLLLLFRSGFRLTSAATTHQAQLSRHLQLAVF